MRATVELPESVYRRTEQAARARGLTVDELISGVLERELGQDPSSSQPQIRIEFPVIRSKQPGTLDLNGFNFDDLLT